MPRPSTGQVIEKDTARGKVYALRFRAYGQRRYETLELGTTRAQADDLLTVRMAEVRLGSYRPPAPAPAPPDERPDPTFHEYAGKWRADWIKNEDPRPRTIEACDWELSHHLLPFFASHTLREITLAEVKRYRSWKLEEGRLGPSAINRTLGRLRTILDVADEDELIDRNPCRRETRKSLRVKPRKPIRTWIEDPEQVVALLDGARQLDQSKERRGLPLARPLLATLAYAGLRISEALALRWRDVDLAGGKIEVDDSKTEASERAVDVQPELRGELIAWRQATPFAGRDDLVFCSTEGRALDRGRVRARILLRAVERANVGREDRGLELLPAGLSPHSLRRTFISWLIAEGEDVAYVRDQAGHSDSSMTLDVYTRSQRSKRTSARSRRREEALRAPLGTESDSGALEGLAG